MADGYENESKRELFESLRPKFGLSDEDMSVENIQKTMKANASSPVLFWDHDPHPSHDPIKTSDWDFSDPVETVDFPVF
jgi:hypothetical protein